MLVTASLAIGVAHYELGREILACEQQMMTRLGLVTLAYQA